jgi:hypothetical protein
MCVCGYQEFPKIVFANSLIGHTLDMLQQRVSSLRLDELSLGGAPGMACAGRNNNRLSYCCHCGEPIAAQAELYLHEDAVYCCSSHRTRAVRMARGLEPGSSSSPVAHRGSTSTGVGLAASHRSWLSLDDFASGSMTSSSSSSSSASADARAPFA